MQGARLFLVCPDCHLEGPVQAQFKGRNFFLTALGTLFDLGEVQFMEAFNQLIIKEGIEEIVLVNDAQCTFVQSALKNEVRFGTEVEEVLIDLSNNSEDVCNIQNQPLKSKQISKLNLKRLAGELMESAFIGDKIIDGLLSLKAVVFNREDQSFQEMFIQFLPLHLSEEADSK